MSTATHLETAESAWRWVLDQVRYDEGGPWIPTTPSDTEPAWDRDGMHSGIGGLAHALAEVAASRPWTDDESALAAAIGERIRAVTPTATDVTYFDGLVSHLQCLVLLREPGVDACVGRLLELAPDGWPDMNDATLGTAAIVLGGLTAIEAGCARGAELAAYAADRLLDEAEETPAGLNWLFVPRRLVPPDKLDDGRPVEMPNWSHGLAGIAAALARAGSVLERPDLVEASRRGAEHLVTLADPASLADGGLALPRRIPHKPDHDEYTWNWCHGPAGTLALFEALDAAGVRDVAGEPPTAWVARCLHSLHTSGIPERRWPGFWDNDGRCCGTAGVGSAVLPHDPAFAMTAGRRTSSTARTSRATARTGGSPSTGTPSRCSRPASVGCRARPGSLASCSAGLTPPIRLRASRKPVVRRRGVSRAAAGGRPSPSARPCRRPTYGR